MMMVMFATLMGSNAFAKHHRGMMKELNLSEEQRKQMKEIRSANRDQMKSLRTQKKELHEKMQNLLKTNGSDSDLKSLHEKLSQTKAQMGKLRFEQMLAIRKILNEDQRKKFHEMKEKRFRGHRDRDSEEG